MNPKMLMTILYGAWKASQGSRAQISRDMAVTVAAGIFVLQSLGLDLTPLMPDELVPQTVTVQVEQRPEREPGAEYVAPVAPVLREEVNGVPYVFVNGRWIAE